MTEQGRHRVTQLTLDQSGQTRSFDIADGDLVFFQNGSMTDATSLGTTTHRRRG